MKRELLGFLDVRLLKWNKNPHSNVSLPSNITGPVISADLLDDTGNEMKIENLKTPIQIKVPSKLAKTGKIECRFLNTKSNQWEKIGLETVKDGEYTICTTNHLSDFATFIANDDELPQSSEFNPQWLWLLLLLIPGLGVIGTVIALLSVMAIKKGIPGISLKSVKISDTETPVDDKMEDNVNDRQDGTEAITEQGSESKKEHLDELPELPSEI